MKLWKTLKNKLDDLEYTHPKIWFCIEAIRFIIFPLALSIMLIYFIIRCDLSTNKQDWETPMIHKAYFEGHSYLIYKRDGICHDENCKCKK